MPIINGALGTIPKILEKNLSRIVGGAQVSEI